MGNRLFLPVGANREPYPFPQTRREELLNRLWQTRTLMPEARTMSLEMLEDYVQTQEEKQRQGHYQKVTPAKRTEPMSDKEYKQTVGTLREYLSWKRRREKAMGLRP